MNHRTLRIELQVCYKGQRPIPKLESLPVRYRIDAKMKISKKAEYAMRAVIGIARNPRNVPLQISELSNSESIPIKFLEQILLSLKKAGILRSKRGANGGYSLEKNPSEISLGSILEIIDGPFDPIGLSTGNRPGTGLEECFFELSELVKNHLDQFSIQDIIEKEKPEGLLAFEI